MSATQKKALLFITVLAIIGIAYRLVSMLTIGGSQIEILKIPADDWIPFAPWMVLFYVCVYLFWIPPILSSLVSYCEFKKILISATVSFAVMFLIYFIFPCSYPRPTLLNPNGWAEELVAWLYMIDLPNNTFPSGHVTSVTMILSATFRKFHPAFAVLYFIWGALIILSTLLIKQHFIIDVAGGLMLAFLMLRYFHKPYSNRERCKGCTHNVFYSYKV